MKKSYLKKMLCILLTAVILISAGCVPNKSSTESNAESKLSGNSVNTSDKVTEPASSAEALTKAPSQTPEPSPELTSSLKTLPRDSFDKEKTDRLMKEFEQLLKTPGNEDRLKSIYEELLTCIDAVSSDAALLMYDSYLDPSDKTASEKYDTYEVMSVNYSDSLMKLFKSVFDTDYADFFKGYLDENIVDQLLSYEPMTDEELKLIDENTALNSEYMDLLTFGSDKYEDPDELKEALMQIYVDIVNNNNRIAELNGYDNYAEYAYETVFQRDYSYEDIKKTSDSVKENIVPLMIASIIIIVQDESFEWLEEPDTTSVNDKLDRITACLEQIDGRLASAMNNIRSKGLIDAEYSDKKMDSGYTSLLYLFNDAYIYDCPSGSNADIGTIIHEFGHYNCFFGKNLRSLYDSLNLDIAEIQSQGMQTVFYNYYPQLNKEHGDIYRKNLIYTLLSSTLAGYCINEAEYEAYTTKDLTVEKAGEIFTRAGEEYGLTEYTADGSWTFIPHVFQSPFYYISYATSALATLELFNVYSDDQSAGIKTYMKIVDTAPDSGFIETLESVGLENVLDPETIRTLSEEVEKNAGLEMTPEMIEYVLGEAA